MTKTSAVGFVALYRWKLKQGFESQFVESWTKVTESLLECGSFGSRLHQGTDGIWYGYAQWPSAAARDDAFARSKDPLNLSKMAEAVQESFPEILMKPVSDLLVLPTQK